MYRPYSCLFAVVLLGGCATTTGDDPLPEETEISFATEREALFDQPFIDPLTDYLIEHHGDPDRQTVLQRVREERNARCEQVARQYADEPSTDAVLAQFNAGYAYSCPQQVADFEQRVEQQPEPEQKPERRPEPESIPETQAADTRTADSISVSEQSLSDCYLLTTIRNFSAAREACQRPAENGDVRSQANMARVAHAFEDYASAHKWAEKAAPNSGDAAYLLARMYAEGQGVSQNMDRAVYWYSQAAGQGHKNARAALDRHAEGIPAEP
jgi:TPR repeat protein